MIIKTITSRPFLFKTFLRAEKKWLDSNARNFISPSFNRISLLPNRHDKFLTSAVTTFKINHCCFTNERNEISGPMNTQNFEDVCNDTIDSLAEYFEELLETCPHLKDYDVNYSDGVLTIKFGSPYGTYVINRQTPNQQIWLSSPTTGPKRYDFDRGHWVYRHDGITLHQLLDREVGNIVKHDVNFSRCAYSGTQHDVAA